MSCHQNNVTAARSARYCNLLEYGRTNESMANVIEWQRCFVFTCCVVSHTRNFFVAWETRIFISSNFALTFPHRMDDSLPTEFDLIVIGTGNGDLSGSSSLNELNSFLSWLLYTCDRFDGINSSCCSQSGGEDSAAYRCQRLLWRPMGIVQFREHSIVCERKCGHWMCHWKCWISMDARSWIYCGSTNGKSDEWFGDHGHGWSERRHCEHRQRPLDKGEGVERIP